MKVFLAEGVAAAPVYDAGELLADEHSAHGAHSWRSTTGTRRHDRAVARGKLSETPGAYGISGASSAQTTTACTATCSVLTRRVSAPCARRGTI